jgi:MHS family shikimate/dehydroshikimate transporter-like MFS transporter
MRKCSHTVHRGFLLFSTCDRPEGQEGPGKDTRFWEESDGAGAGRPARQMGYSLLLDSCMSHPAAIVYADAMLSRLPPRISDSMDRGPPSSPSAVPVVVASFVGTALEWYDFFLYGMAAALVFNRLFFPTFDPAAGTMAAFATYAVGFAARPFGGILFSHYGDRVGRKSVLVATLLIVGIATFLIGVLPTYESAGVAAPLLLVSLRFVQGLGVGGEWAGAVLMVAERGNPRRRGFATSWVQAGAPIGLLLATGAFGAVSLLPEPDFLTWGWRIPFLLGLLLTGVGLFVRLKVLESPLLLEALRETPPPRLPIVEVLLRHRRNVILAMGARMAENVFFYFFTVFALNYGTERMSLSRNTMLEAVLLGAAAHLVAIPAFGAISDRLGRRPVYIGGAVFLGAFAFPFFLLADGGAAAMRWGIVLGMIGHAAMYGPQAAFLAELFGTRVRYTGASLGYQLAAPLSGGLAPLIAAALIGWSGGDPWPVAAYLVAMSVLTVVSVVLASETSGRDLAVAESLPVGSS